MVIENHYIQTSLMVALSLFRGKEGGAHVYESEVNIKTVCCAQIAVDFLVACTHFNII